MGDEVVTLFGWCRVGLGLQRWTTTAPDMRLKRNMISVLLLG